MLDISHSQGINARQISELFNSRFGIRYNTLLHGGAREPLYIPADLHRNVPAELHFTSDYPRSALHEIAHWCIAGPERRRLVDFGYRYVPPPRTLDQQRQFFQQELQTQALESIFCEACGIPFSPSADNFAVEASMVLGFAGKVAECAKQWRIGISGRADFFVRCLQDIKSQA
ncbi:MAG: elongation factor P hydroxylase [Pseudomonadales bacterium]|nr:elongation factor P hydroxylase [Pseudomonadales bacterium]